VSDVKGLDIKSKQDCRWDCLSLGEIMIRLEPEDVRIRTARNFRAWEGGGEYNVTRALSKVFGMRTAVVTGIVRNDLGYLLLDFINQGGVDTRYIKWFDFDGIGKEVRIGLNFTERGFGIRGAVGIYDRANSAASKLKKGDINWEKIFKDDGVRWFHTGGIFVALSETTPDVVIEAIKCAKENNTIVSYDLNYRASLWKAMGGQKKAIEINREIAKYVDVMIGNEEDFTACLGFKVEGVDKNLSKLDPENFKKMIASSIREYPNFKAVATTLREVKTATKNGWGAVLYYGGKFYEATKRENLEIYDRVGGGDSFASGLIYSFLSDKSPQEAVGYGAAHGALAMTTPGDTSMASLDEVEKIVSGGSARISR
jgi:2-dehydro-3-deoxygluconokinase